MAHGHTDTVPVVSWVNGKYATDDYSHGELDVSLCHSVQRAPEKRSGWRSARGSRCQRLYDRECRSSDSQITSPGTMPIIDVMACGVGDVAGERELCFGLHGP